MIELSTGDILTDAQLARCSTISRLLDGGGLKGLAIAIIDAIGSDYAGLFTVYVPPFKTIENGIIDRTTVTVSKPGATASWSVNETSFHFDIDNRVPHPARFQEWLDNLDLNRMEYSPEYPVPSADSDSFTKMEYVAGPRPVPSLSNPEQRLVNGVWVDVTYFNVGDVVILKSGGHKMTVESLHQKDQPDEFYTASWSDGTGQILRSTFPSACLKFASAVDELRHIPERGGFFPSKAAQETYTNLKGRR